MNKKFQCYACKKPILGRQHYFTVTSNHPKDALTYDTTRCHFHLDCMPENIKDFFKEHIKKEFKPIDFGVCSFRGCAKQATLKKGALVYCREHAEEIERGN